MIVLNLSCDKEHVFEGWFGSSEAYDDQRARELVACPVCGSTRIDRRPTAPYVQTRSTVQTSSPARPPQGSRPAHAQQALAAVMTALRQAASESEDVGERFPEEARRIHYGESEARNIRGQASRDDVSELLEEGIMVLPVPQAEEDLH